MQVVDELQTGFLMDWFWVQCCYKITNEFQLLWDIFTGLFHSRDNTI